MLGALVASAITLPWIGRGWLLALDWVAGPQSKPPPRWGLTPDGQPSIAVNAVVRLCSWLVGGPTVSWLTIWAALFLAVVLAARITPGGPVAKCVSGAFYGVNPFVFERLYAGQVYVLLGYALLPLVASSIVRSSSRTGWQRWTAAVWITLDGAISIHFIWIGLVLALGSLIWRRSARQVFWFLKLVAVTAVLNAYLLLPTLLQHSTVAVGNSDLAAFRSTADHVYGLYINVLGLYGFWRPGPTLPKSFVVAWPVALAAILIAASIGWWRWAVGRSDDLVGMLAPAAALAFALSLGDQGPTGSVFRLLYAHLPGFAVMREPDKFAAVLALAYAVCGGIGVEVLARRLNGRRPAIYGIIGLIGVAAYTPTIFWGLGGELSVSTYPADWQVANRIMGNGPGSILSLPLNEYESFSFTGKRVIANPAPDVFTRHVIVGGVVDAGPLLSDSSSPVDSFLTATMNRESRTHELGHLLSPLGIRYIVLFKTANAREYGWIQNQQDLTQVFNSPDIAVYRNPYAIVDGARLGAALTVPSIDCYFRLADRSSLLGIAVFISPQSTCPSRTVAHGSPIPDVTAGSSVSYHVKAGPSGYAEIPQAANGTWTAPDSRGLKLADGIQAFRATAIPFPIRYRHWWAPLIGDSISVIAMASLWLGYYLARRRYSPDDGRRPGFG